MGKSVCVCESTRSLRPHVVSKTAWNPARQQGTNQSKHPCWPRKNHGDGLKVIPSVSNASEGAVSSTVAGYTESDRLDHDTQQQGWSPLLKNSTAILHDATDGKTAYILGVSHVSKESCALIEELIEKVAPDAVVLELCHERTGLLIDEKAASTGQNAWFSDAVDVVGLDETLHTYKGELLKRLRTYGGHPVSTQGIQSDADVLIATGLFESVTPITAPPAESGWDPMFVFLNNAKRLIPGVKLGAIQFKVVPRRLPHIDGIAEVVVEEIPNHLDRNGICDVIEKSMVHARASQMNTLDSLIEVKKQVHRYSGGTCDIMYQFDGENDGSMKVMARIVLSKGSMFEYVTSFEETVRQDGTGIGIQRRGNAPRFMGSQAATQSSLMLETITPWDINEKHNIAEDSRKTNQGVLESLATMVTMTYGKYQADAGRQVGILPGEAWRVAFEAAAKSKTPYIFLGDRRASITAERLLKAMIASSLPLYLAGAVASAASWLTPPLLLNLQPSIPVTLMTACISIGAASWPLLSPILEIKAFSELSAKEIENAVRVNEPLQSTTTTGPFYLWGEDALIRWPGAEEPVILERDEYMAKAVHGILNNITSNLTPTYVATSEEPYGATIYSYAMPKHASSIVCPPGKGQGQCDPCAGNPSTVVAIVGTAHVRGMIQHFKKGFTTANSLEKLSM